MKHFLPFLKKTTKTLLIIALAFGLSNVASAENLLKNRGFENRTFGWRGYQTTYQVVSSPTHSGSGVAKVAHTAKFQGVQQNITKVLKSNGAGLYQGSAAILAETGLLNARANIRIIMNDNSKTYLSFSQASVTDYLWKFSEGSVEITDEMLLNMKKAYFYVETSSNTTNDFFVDACWLEKIPQVVKPNAPDYNHAFYRWYNKSIEVIWGDNSNNEEGFYVLDSIDGVNGWNIIGQTEANVDRIDIPSTMSECEMHYIAVVAFNQAGTSAKSRIVEVEPSCEISAPTNLTETIDDLKVTLNWADNAENETGYRLYRVHDDGYWMWTEMVTDLPANTTSYTFNGELCSYNSYHIVALYNKFESNSTNNVFFQLRCDIESPSNLTLVEVTETTATISWTDNSDNEDGFAIQNCLKGGCSGMVFASANQTEITIDLDPNEIYGYSFQVVATKNDRHSFESNNITFYPAVYAPSDLTITRQTVTTVDLVWEDNSQVENTYDIYRSTNGIDFEYIKYADANATSITVELNAQESINYFQVRATTWAGSSSPSNTVVVNSQSELQFKTAIPSICSEKSFDVQIAPSIVQSNAKLVFNATVNSKTTIEVFTITGTKIFETIISPNMVGQYMYMLDAADYDKGSYILRVTSVRESEVLSKSVRFIKN